MSFGFSVGDFFAVLKICQGVYEALKDGPDEYKELQGEMKSLRYAIQSLSDDAKDPESLLNRKGSGRKAELMDVIANCERTMREMQDLVDKHSSLSDEGEKQGRRVRRVWDAYRIGGADLDSLRGKLTFHTSTISMFLISLEGSAIGRMERLLEKIAARVLQEEAFHARQSQTSLVSTASSVLEQIETQEDDVWARLKDELLVANVSSAHMMAHREEIIEYIKSLLMNGVSTNAEMSVRKEPPVSLDSIVQAASSAEESWKSQDKATAGRVMKFPRSVSVEKLPATISEFRPVCIQYWERGDASITTTVTSIRHGTYEGTRSCIVFLNVDFIYNFKQPFISAHINCILHDLGYNGIPHGIPILEPKHLSGPLVQIERRSRVGISLSDVNVGILMTVEPFAGISKSSNSNYHLWTVDGYRGYDGSSGTWTLTTDRNYGGALPGKMGLGMIIRHAGQPVLLRVEVKASMKSKWAGLMAPSMGGVIPTTHSIEPLEKDEVFTAQSLRSVVESRNVR